jgi:hypothetical protein
MTMYGYARVSTREQDLSGEIAELQPLLQKYNMLGQQAPSKPADALRRCSWRHRRLLTRLKRVVSAASPSA